MHTIKHFTKEGNLYTLKRQYGFGLIIVIGLALFAFIGYKIDKPAMIWVFGIFAILSFLAVWFKSVVVDLNQKTIKVKAGLINPVVEIPFTDFRNFEFVKTSQFFITTNTQLNIQYLKAGKEKAVLVAQGFTGSAVQQIANELEEIMSGK